MNRECEECIRRCFPSDPRVGGYARVYGRGRVYLPPFCRRCNGYVEEEPKEVVVQSTNKELINQQHKTQVLIRDLENRLNTHVDKYKKDEWY